MSDNVLLFAGCETRGGSAGIHLTQSREGRPSGEAFVEFASEEDLQMALKKNKDHLGNRYIEGQIPECMALLSVCISLFIFTTVFSDLGFLHGKLPAATELLDLTYSACWMFQCFHNPPNSDMDHWISNVPIWSFCLHTCGTQIFKVSSEEIFGVIEAAQNFDSRETGLSRCTKPCMKRLSIHVVTTFNCA